MRRLLLRPGAIGDCILSLPSLEYLARDVGAEIWISAPVVPLIRFAQRVRSLVSTGIDLLGLQDVSLPAQLTPDLSSFDEIVSWYGWHRPEFREALASTGVPCVFHRALPPSGFRGHATDFFLEQVGAPQGMTPAIEIAATAERNTVVIHPFSGGARKDWPLARFEKLAEELTCPVEWTAGPEETLSRAIRFDRLDELARWMKGAQLYIGNDSGITHLAAAIGTKVLALFGPTDPKTWAPRGENVSILHVDPLESLEVGQVLDAANRLLDSA
jgi:ADP-heptose:LPS heptosyltransferase